MSSTLPDLPDIQQSSAQHMARLENFMAALEAAHADDDGFQNATILDIRTFPGQVVIVGDLHGRADNLRRILAHSDTWGQVLRGESMLLLLGDLIHEEDLLRLAHMDRSWQLLEYFMELKIEAPHHVHALLGNHDLLYGTRMKGPMFGNKVNQSQAYLDRLRRHMGPTAPAYLELYSRYLSAMPLMCMAKSFAAVHAGPIRGATLEEIHRCPILDGEPADQSKILCDAIYGRWHTLSRSEGYRPEDVRAFLQVCGCPGGHLIVGHSKFPGELSWHWDLMENHHVLTAVRDGIGVALADPTGVRYVSLGEAPAQPAPPGPGSLYDFCAPDHFRAVRSYLLDTWGTASAIAVVRGMALPYDHYAWKQVCDRVALKPNLIRQALAGIPLESPISELPCTDRQLRMGPARPLSALVEVNDRPVSLGRIRDEQFVWIPAL